MKDKLKKIPFFKYINYFRIKLILKSENKYSNRMFLKYFINSLRKTEKNYEYEIMLAIHKIEKGLSCKKTRPFGIDKIKKIISCINYISKDTYVYNYAYNILVEYKKNYELNKWNDRDEFLLVSTFLNNNNNYKKMNVGSFEYKYADNIEYANIDYDKFMSSRHSIRNFKNQELSSIDIEKAINIARKSPTACNRQMCKIYYAKKAKSKEILKKRAQGLGLFEFDGLNYFVVTYDLSSCLFVGEQYQGLFNAGLVSMNFVNGLHSIGIGSCFIQFGNRHDDEDEIKKILDIPESERIAIIIVAGYYDTVSRIPCSVRKEKENIFFVR